MHEKGLIGPYARWLEDFRLGETIVTQGRTITETDGAIWAGLSGDLHPLHVDAEAAAATGMFGERFPPGLMTIAIASGLKERLGMFHGTALAVLAQSVRYREPVLFGDTIRVSMRVDAIDPRPDKHRGKLTLYYEVMKGESTVCSEGELSLIMLMRQDDAHPTYGPGAAPRPAMTMTDGWTSGRRLYRRGHPAT
jgi:acyl dehydratase